MGEAWKAMGGRSGWWRRLSYDLPCPTVVTMPNHAGTALCHPEEVRALTLRECALIQEFPLDWELSGSPQQQYAQVGNAVPVRLGVVAGETLAQHMDVLAAKRWRKQTLDAPPFRVVYVQSHVRTRQWFKSGQVFVWRDGRANHDAAYAAPKTLRAVKGLA